jgi:hypothetical protein
VSTATDYDFAPVDQETIDKIKAEVAAESGLEMDRAYGRRLSSYYGGKAFVAWSMATGENEPAAFIRDCLQHLKEQGAIENPDLLFENALMLMEAQS